MATTEEPRKTKPTRAIMFCLLAPNIHPRVVTGNTPDHRGEGNRGKNGVTKSQNAELAPPKSALFLAEDYCPVSRQQATLAVQPRRTEIEPRGR